MFWLDNCMMFGQPKSHMTTTPSSACLLNHEYRLAIRSQAKCPRKARHFVDTLKAWQYPGAEWMEKTLLRCCCWSDLAINGETWKSRVTLCKPVETVANLPWWPWWITSLDLPVVRLHSAGPSVSRRWRQMQNRSRETKLWWTISAAAAPRRAKVHHLNGGQWGAKRSDKGGGGVNLLCCQSDGTVWNTVCSQNTSSVQFSLPLTPLRCF